MKTTITVDHGQLDTRVTLQVESRDETWSGTDKISARDMAHMLRRVHLCVPALRYADKAPAGIVAAAWKADPETWNIIKRGALTDQSEEQNDAP